MPSQKDLLLHSTAIIRLVADDLRNCIDEGFVWDFEMREFADRLDLAHELVRSSTARDGDSGRIRPSGYETFGAIHPDGAAPVR